MTQLPFPASRTLLKNCPVHLWGRSRELGPSTLLRDLQDWIFLTESLAQV